ncbi:MAG TPA: heliorhodopsin HeR [Candidatus Saccharimonadales bacterium]|nr:heliorhodopsin HeR [Candidatus Saccharimonadales bacterium]
MAKKKEETKAKKSKSAQGAKTKAVTTNASAAKTATKVSTDTEKSAKPVASTTVRTVKAAAPKPQDTNAVLQRWHMVAGAFLGLQGLLIALLGKSASVPVVMHYPALDTLASEANKHDVYGVAGRQLFDMPIAYVVSAALLAAAVIYIAAATNFRAQFEAKMNRGVNVVRWLVYAIGGAVLLDAVYLLSGINDFLALKLLAGVFVGACAAGLAVDLLGAERRGLGRLLKLMALVGGLLPWVALIGGLVATLLYDGNLPGYMYGVYASGFILSVAIGLALLFRWRQRGRFASTLYSEKMFLLLGLATGSVLAWQIFAGALL